MFGDPVDNPHGFRKVALSELAEIRIGPFGSLLHKEDYIEGGHPLLNPSHIVDGKVAPDSKLTISDKKYDELEAYHLHTGDVVMGRRGEMGRCAVVPSEGFLCGTGSLLIRTKGEVTADYIQKTISFPSFRKTIEDMAVGQTMPNLNVPIVSKFQIIKPPIEVQINYYKFVAQTDKSKSFDDLGSMRFSDVLDIRNGRNQRQVENENGKYPIYGSGGVMGHADDFICDAETVVIGRKGSINNPIFVDEPFWNVDTAFGLVAHKEVLLPKYLYYFCVNFDFERLNTTVTIPSLTKANLLQIEIRVPDMDIQQNIVSVLDKICYLIELRQKELYNLDQLVKSRFIEMFGVYPANPMGWEIGTIRDIVTEVRYGSSRPAVDGGKYPYLRMNNITYGGELDLSDTKRIDIPDNELDKCTVRRGDVLFNRTNSKELVGKTCVYDRDEMMVLAGFVIRIRVKDCILPEFLSAFLNTDFSKQMLLGMCKTAIGQANINAQELQNIGLYLPPVELQRRFIQFKKETDKSKYRQEKCIGFFQCLEKSIRQEWL